MKKTIHNKRVIIMGGGLAGLSAGYELVKAGRDVAIVEKCDQVGGLARTINVNGFRFDTGPHRWYTKNDMVNTWMLKLLGDEVIKVPRLTRIYFDKKFYEYPIKIKSTLEGMGLWRTAKAAFDYALVRLKQLFRKDEPLTLEEGYVDKFGRTLYEMFFKRYSEKLWGRSCREISADWIGQRTRGYDVGTILREMLFKSKNIVSFVDEFSYPKNGIGRIAAKLAEDIIKGGGKIFLNNNVTQVRYENNRIISVTIIGRRGRQLLVADEVVSSIPLSELIVSFIPKPSSDLLNVARRLEYRDEMQVALFINRTHITADTWVYVHSLDIPFVRFMEMDNWSSSLSPKGTTTIVFEIACNEGDGLWTKLDREIISVVTESFIREFGLISKKDILGAYVHRVLKEYPVYHLGYRQDVKKLKKHLSQFANLQLAGRNGTFRYNNMDHSIEMGLYAAWNIIESGRKFDIESVNIDREYLEEKHFKSKDLELAEDQHVEEQKHYT